MKTQAKYLAMAPFPKKSILRLVESYQAVSEPVKDLKLQDHGRKISERGVVLKTRTATAKLHREV